MCEILRKFDIDRVNRKIKGGRFLGHSVYTSIQTNPISDNFLNRLKIPASLLNTPWWWTKPVACQDFTLGGEVGAQKLRRYTFSRKSWRHFFSRHPQNLSGIHIFGYLAYLRPAEHCTGPTSRQSHWTIGGHGTLTPVATPLNKALHDLLPACQAGDCHFLYVTGRRRLRSSNVDMCQVQRINLITSWRSLIRGSCSTEWQCFCALRTNRLTYLLLLMLCCGNVKKVQRQNRGQNRKFFQLLSVLMSILNLYSA